MDITHLTVEVRDKDLNRIGQIPLADLSLTIEDQFCNVGSWTLSLPSESPLAGILRQPGSGIIVTLENGDVLMSGPTIKPEDAATSTDPNGTLTVNGLTDTVLLADRLCFPNPANLDPANQPNTHDVRTGTCEDLMFAYVNANIGPAAPVSADPSLGSRRDNRLQLGANSSRGPVVTKRARFDVLGSLLNELAVTAGIGFRVVQVGNRLEFQTFDVADRSRSIRLDIRNNMLAGHRIATAPPSITRAIVAGQDVQREPEQSDKEWQYERQFVAVSTPESRAGEEEWGRRVEVFIDRRQEDGNDELVQAGAEALQKGGYSQISVQVVPMEDFYSNFGVDWHLGDHITVVVQGVEMQADITGYVLKYDNNGFRMGVTLGDPAALNRSPATAMQGLDARVSNLERGSVTTAAVEAASVTVLNPGEYTQDTTPAAYPQGESLVYVQDTFNEGWSALGLSSGAVRSVHVDGEGRVAQTFQAQSGVFTEPKLYIRSGVEGFGFTDWRLVATEKFVNDIEATGERVVRLSAANYTVTTPSQSYPEGESVLWLTNTDTLDGGWPWPGVWGYVHTSNYGNQITQTWRPVSNSDQVIDMWVRGGNHQSWGAWYPLADRQVLKSSVKPVVGQWYRIASFPTSQGGLGAKASAEFIITSDGSGHHAFIRLRATVAYNYDRATLSVEECSGYGATPLFTKARIVSLNSTYDGHALEVYCGATVTDVGVQMVVKHDDWRMNDGDRTRWTNLGFFGTAATPAAPQTVLMQRGIGYTGEWIAPTLGNGWVYYGAGYEPPAYKMDPGGRVFLKGLIKSGTVDVNGGAPVFTLPEGYRPSNRQLFMAAAGGNTVGRIDVIEDGRVVVAGGVNSYQSMDGLSFLAIQ